MFYRSTNDLNGIRKNLHTQSFNVSQTSPRYSNDTEVHEMNAMVDDIERELHQISQRLKQVNKYLLHLVLVFIK